MLFDAKLSDWLLVAALLLAVMLLRGQSGGEDEGYLDPRDLYRPAAPKAAESSEVMWCKPKPRRKNGKCKKGQHPLGQLGTCEKCQVCWYRGRAKKDNRYACPSGWHDTGAQPPNRRQCKRCKSY